MAKFVFIITLKSMSSLVVITLPDVKLENFLSLTQESSFFEIFVAGRFRVIDFIIGNFERVGFEEYLIVGDITQSLIDLLIYSWRNLKFLALRKTNNFKLVYSNFSVATYNIFTSDSEKGSFDLYAFLNNYSSIIWSNGFPIWFDLNSYLEELNLRSISLLFSKVGGKPVYHTSKFTKRYFSEFLEILERGVYESFYLKYASHNSIETDYFIFMPFTSLRDYFKMSLSILDQKKINEFEVIFGKYPIMVKSDDISQVVIGKHGGFYSALIGGGSFVDSFVENSIVCPGVKIGKNCIVRNAIIYPGNWIADNVQIQNAIIDSFSLNIGYPNIGYNSIIGGRGLGAPSIKYPSILNFDAAVIGKNVVIPKNVQVSLNAYVPSGVNLSKVKALKYVKSNTVF